MTDQVTFSASGEMDNGFTISTSLQLDGVGAAATTNGHFDDRSITIDTGDMGKITFSGHGSSGPVGAWDDLTPTANEEAHGSTIAGTISGPMSAAGTNDIFVYDYTVMDGLALKASYTPSDGTTDIEASSDYGLMFTGVDGLTVFAGISMVEQYQNAASVTGDKEEKVVGFTYVGSGMADRISVGAQMSQEDTGVTGTTEYENTAYSLTFKVSDELSIGYAHVESDETGQDKASPEADSVQIAYTMGGASFRIAEVATRNQAYSTAAGADVDGTVISMGLAF